jgi:hypothetical protein
VVFLKGYKFLEGDKDQWEELLNQLRISQEMNVLNRFSNTTGSIYECVTVIELVFRKSLVTVSQAFSLTTSSRV